MGMLASIIYGVLTGYLVYDVYKLSCENKRLTDYIMASRDAEAFKAITTPKTYKLTKEQLKAKSKADTETQVYNKAMSDGFIDDNGLKVIEETGGVIQ